MMAIDNINNSPGARLKAAYQKRGALFLARKAVCGTLRRLRNASYAFYLKMRPARRFAFRGRSLRYFYHSYNTTWDNERCVEVAIALDAIRSAKEGARILEIGNVLNMYAPFPHDVVDKFERAPGVLNEDVITFSPARPYDLIVSVSTMEHVGWDEEPRRPGDVLRGFENLTRKCLAAGGTLLVTVPVGYNGALDTYLAQGLIGFTTLYFMKHIYPDDVWLEVSKDEAMRTPYGARYRGANAIVVGVFEKSDTQKP